MENKFIRLENKMDKQNEDITEIKVSMGEIATQLKNMNGTILRHNKSIDCHRKKINKINYNLAIGIGAISVIILILNVFV